MINIYKKIWMLLSINEKKNAVLLLIMMIGMAFLEVVGIGSIMPFLAVLGNPEIVQTNSYLVFIYNYFNFSNIKSFLLFLGIMAFVILLSSAIFKSLTQYALVNFSNMRRHTIAEKLLSKYLHQPYSFFLKRNSSDMSKTILSEVDVLIGQVLAPSLRLITYSIVTIALISFLVYVDPILALILILLFGGFYAFMYLIIRKYITFIGKERAKANSSRFKVASEAIGGIKELKILGREKIYLDNFRKPSFKFSNYTSKNQILAQIPQFLVEVIAFGAILAMAMYTLENNEVGMGKLLPVLGLYALGIMKLKPAIHYIYSSLSTMKFGAPAIDAVIRDLQSLPKEYAVIKNNNRKLLLTNELELKNISFNYEDTIQPALENINIKIEANTTVGIIGITGAGKSTLVDIILGLLSPKSGEILVDGKILSKQNIREWQNSIGYVPQSIFLADDTIASNIAFGVHKKNIDMHIIEKVAKMAQVHKFIITLENGYNTEIGERGVRLSGGQRQRLGIARALYHNPELLVLDEATSALDNETEFEVMKAIDSISGSKTIIMIAHRLSTVEKCDMIIKLKNGKVTEISNKKSLKG